MSPDTDPHDHHPAADSAGVPWEGRRFESNRHSDDDGSADPRLLAALTAFREGHGDQSAVVDAYRTARLLIPLVADRGDQGVGPHGIVVDKTQELSIVTVAAPDGRRVLPVFTSVAAMGRWDAAARPVPADGARTAVAASADDTDLIVIDPGSETEFVIRRPAVWAIAQGIAVGAELRVAGGVRGSAGERPAGARRDRPERRAGRPDRPASRTRSSSCGSS